MYFDRVFLRGAMSIGKFFRSRSLVIGPAVDDAVQWHAVADWIGVIMTPSASYELDYLVDVHVGSDERSAVWLRDVSPHLFERYDVPRSGGGTIEDCLALAWPRRWQQEQDTEAFWPRDQLLRAFAKAPISVEAEPKYRHTLDFYDHVVQRASGKWGIGRSVDSLMNKPQAAGHTIVLRADLIPKR
jgi:hypothetical protein